jgi:ABC-type Mn2+/Zn2+ transport system ATPase subunit
MLVARDVEVRAGARLLLEHASFQVAPGDKIGLVGRNGAGKTTLTRILSGEAQPANGTITRTGPVGYLPQDPRTGDLDVLAKNRILSARGLDAVVDRLQRAELAMGDDSADVRDKAMASYARAEAELAAAGGYAAEAEAARIASNLGLPERVLHQPLETLSGGQRRRIELARILFSGAPTLLLDEPTNHLDADSIVWLRDFLSGHSGGLLVITHDAGLALQPRRTLLIVEHAVAAIVAGAIILPFQPSFAAILAIGVVPLIAYPYWRDVRLFPSWWASVSRPLLIWAVLAGAALLATAAIAFPRQIGGTDEAARGGWWLDYAEHATVLALAGVLAASRGPGCRILRDLCRGLAVPRTSRHTGSPATPRIVGSHRRRGCSSGRRRFRRCGLARL